MIAGNTRVEYDLGTIDITNDDFVGAQRPILVLMPYFGQYGNQSTSAYFADNVGFYDFYVDLVSVSNPQKKLSFKLGTRSKDSMELNIAVAGDDGGYGAECWYLSHAAQRDKAKRFDKWKDNAALSTQKYNFANQSSRTGFKDKYGVEISKPHPISIYYDMNEHMTYTDTGFKGKSNGIDRGLDTMVKIGSEYRYALRDMDFKYNDAEGKAWTPWTEQEASAVKVKMRFDRPVSENNVCKMAVYALGDKRMDDYADGGETVGEVLATAATVTNTAYKLKYKSNGAVLTVQTVKAGDIPTAPQAPVRDGLIFKGWYNGQSEFLFNEALSADTELTALWKRVCPDCSTENAENAAKCEHCRRVLIEGAESDTPNDEKNNTDSGCGSETVALLGTTLAGLGALMLIKRK